MRQEFVEWARVIVSAIGALLLIGLIVAMAGRAVDLFAR